MSLLYHYTCDHMAPRIIEAGELRPHGLREHRPLVWLTDLATPNRAALSLTSHILTCDRTRHRFVVEDQPSIVPWWAWRRAHPDYLQWAQVLESEPDARPRHWFVSESAVPIVREMP